MLVSQETIHFMIFNPLSSLSMIACTIFSPPQMDNNGCMIQGGCVSDPSLCEKMAG
jgi:hypothetical protein